MSQQRSSMRGTSQSNLLRTELGGLQRVGRPKNSSRSLLNTSVAALLEGHAPPVHPQQGLNPLARAALLNRTLPAVAAAGENPNATQRRMLMERRQLQQWQVSPLQPPPGFSVNTRLELQSSLSNLAVGDHNQLRYTHGPITGAVNSSVQRVDKGKRPLLAEQVNPNPAAKKRPAVERESGSKKYNPITKRMMAMKADAHRNGIELMKNMPTVWAKGVGPYARKVKGFLYSYGSMQRDDGEDVTIMCCCHGALHSPSAFLKHAGGIDVAEPMKHISVNVMVSAPQSLP